jgi:hypothetical protein
MQRSCWFVAPLDSDKAVNLSKIAFIELYKNEVQLYTENQYKVWVFNSVEVAKDIYENMIKLVQFHGCRS